MTIIGYNMTQRPWTALLAGLFAAAFIACASPTFAQENVENQVDTNQQDAQDKIEAAFDLITASIAELNRLRIALPDLEPGFRELMQRRIDDKEEQVWLAVKSVSRQVIDSEDAYLSTTRPDSRLA